MRNKWRMVQLPMLGFFCAMPRILQILFYLCRNFLKECRGVIFVLCVWEVRDKVCVTFSRLVWTNVHSNLLPGGAL
ncbi:hypothetical protein ALQ61_200087 [Pseudomonas coronafaciens pv. zizaniae]|nr:hypothetical protein ALQ61_200087 [Pseudomonas coronafaciens pv. zizaniae]